jgi:hypothetical protein
MQVVLYFEVLYCELSVFWSANRNFTIDIDIDIDIDTYNTCTVPDSTAGPTSMQSAKH